MKELFRSNDAVLLSYADALLKDAGIDHVVADGNMAVMEGTLGILPRRMLVAQDQWEEAASILRGAELGDVLGDK
jgi:hypothetical protein